MHNLNSGSLVDKYKSKRYEGIHDAGHKTVKDYFDSIKNSRAHVNTLNNLKLLTIVIDLFMRYPEVGVDHYLVVAYLVGFAIRQLLAVIEYQHAIR